ncbi:hypothetical protein [Bradyrhizobium sp.]
MGDASSTTSNGEIAHKSPDFRKEWRKFDDLTDQTDPHLYEVAEVLDGGS